MSESRGDSEFSKNFIIFSAFSVGRKKKEKARGRKEGHFHSEYGRTVT